MESKTLVWGKNDYPWTYFGESNGGSEMTLFQVAIVDEESILVAPTFVMAKDEKAAILIIGQAHPAIKLKKAKVLVRPFV